MTMHQLSDTVACFLVEITNCDREVSFTKVEMGERPGGIFVHFVCDVVEGTTDMSLAAGAYVAHGRFWRRQDLGSTTASLMDGLPTQVVTSIWSHDPFDAFMHELKMLMGPRAVAVRVADAADAHRLMQEGGQKLNGFSSQRMWEGVIECAQSFDSSKVKKYTALIVDAGEQFSDDVCGYGRPAVAYWHCRVGRNWHSSLGSVAGQSPARLGRKEGRQVAACSVRRPSVCGRLCTPKLAMSCVQLCSKLYRLRGNDSAGIVSCADMLLW